MHIFVKLITKKKKKKKKKLITYVTAHCDYLSFKYVFLRQLAPFLQVVEVLNHA